MKNLEHNQDSTPPIFSQEEMDRMANQPTKSVTPEKKSESHLDLTDEEMDKIYEKDPEYWKN